MNHGTSTLAEVENVVRHYAGPRESLFGQRRFVHAVDGIDLVIHQGEAVGLVGESGCGKSTVGRLIQGIESPTSGRVRVDGIDVSDLDAAGRRNLGRHVQTIYQNPVGSLDPRVRIGRQIREPLDIHKVGTPAERRDRVIDLLDNVGLSARYADRFPHEVSGGEAQRIVIARALTLKPKLIICDEPVSSLDVAIQRQVVRLLTDIKDRFNVSYLFISHDLNVVREICERVAIMYLGQIVEEGKTESIFRRPAHPYTQALLSAVPRPDPRARAAAFLLTGDVPSPSDVPPGCRLNTRCPYAAEICRNSVPALVPMGLSQRAACHFVAGPGSPQPRDEKDP
jgi:oligopeptide/dipeptide ABC transporter ATP-binding protein